MKNSPPPDCTGCAQPNDNLHLNCTRCTRCPLSFESASNNYICLFNLDLHPILSFNPGCRAKQEQMHDNRHMRSPVIITTALYGTHMAHIFIRVCALIYNGVSPSTFARHLGHQYLPQQAVVIPHLLTPPLRCSRHQAEACCTAQTAWVAWRVDGTSALTSANRRAPGGARTGLRD